MQLYLHPTLHHNYVFIQVVYVIAGPENEADTSAKYVYSQFAKHIMSILQYLQLASKWW
jgi:hypothetical protein